MRPGRRAAVALLAFVVALVVLVLGTQRPAAAHATLQDTQPLGDAVLATAPKEVVLRFDEPVTAAPGAIRVFDAGGRRVDDGDVDHPGGVATAVRVRLPGVPEGGYVVTFRIASADSHPVQGAFTFRVGEGGASAGRSLSASLLADRRGSQVVRDTFAAVRAVAFAAGLVVIGGLFLALTAWPAGLAAGGGGRRLLLGALGALAVATVLGIGLQGAHGGGLGLADAGRPAVVRTVLGSRYGHTALARLLVAVDLALLVAVVGPRVQARRMLTFVAAPSLLVLAASFTWAGHAGTGRWVPVALATDVVHVLAAGVWAGGLVMLVVALRASDAAEADAVAVAFSRAAFASVAVLVASGTLQGLRQIGSVEALRSTDYGKVLTAKVVAVAALVTLGALSRRALRAAAEAGERMRSLRRSVGLEVLVGAAVVVLSAVLVETTPARTAVSTPFSTELTSPTMLLDLTLEPGRAGPTDVHLYTLTPAGARVDPVEVTATIQLPARGIGPITLPVRRATPGHWAAYGAQVPLPGRWHLQVTVRTSDVDQQRFETDFTLR